MAPRDPTEASAPNVFALNLFAEGYIAYGKAFTPVKHQAMLAEDLANLPQFLCQPDDIVLTSKRPAAGFLNALRQAGFAVPEFVELKGGRIAPSASLCQRRLGNLRPWAWGPDSIQLLEPLFAQAASEAGNAHQYFNNDIARLYSKAWSAGFLRKVLSRCREAWLCSEDEAGVAVNTLEEALVAVAAIRGRGHQRVVVKEALGLAGHNAIRLWEPELLPTQRQWLAHALESGRELVVEPWLEREVDFSVQLEMGTRGLTLCGYTELFTDLKGQFLANGAEPNYSQCLPAKVAGFRPTDISDGLQNLYGEIFSTLEGELRSAGFVGPISIDAFVYRTPERDCRVKPVVEVNPRYTMGRVTLELMKHACPGSHGLFRLINRAQTRAEGFADLADYAASLSQRLPLRLESGRSLGRSFRRRTKIREGAVCLNDPAHAQVCLATFEVNSAAAF